jgi:Holliday junction resolvasome RuvABC endonuclease subunit
MTGAVLALDLGSNVGWAVRRADGVVLHGAKSFPQRGPKERPGRRHFEFKRWLTEMKSQYEGIDTVFYEKIDFAQGNQTIILMQTGILLWWCEHHGFDYRGFSPGTIKKAATGNGRATKEEMIEALKERGYSPCSDHTADAIGCLLAGMPT